MSEVKNCAWFLRHQPKTLNDLVFDNDEHKTLMEKWVADERIDGNVLMYGKAGLGKTASAEILINSIIKAQNDLCSAEDRSVAEIRDIVKPFLTKRPVKSKQKVVYIEEMDKLHKEAVNVLKKGLMEKHTENTTFICCTNYIRRIEPALLSRFTYKIPFSGTNLEGVFLRMCDILDQEKATYDSDDLKVFLTKNLRLGVRELVNVLQIAYVVGHGTIDLQNAQGYVGIEENLVNITLNILKTTKTLNPKDKNLVLLHPMQTPIVNDFQTLCSTLHNNFDINYDTLYDNLIERVSMFIPLQLICARFAESNDMKKYPHLNFIDCLMEMLKCLCTMNL